MSDYIEMMELADRFINKKYGITNKDNNKNIDPDKKTKIDICHQKSIDYWKCVYENQHRENTNMFCSEYYYNMFNCINKI